MTSDTANGAGPAAGVGRDLDEWDDAEDLDGIDAADDGGDSQATDEYAHCGLLARGGAYAALVCAQSSGGGQLDVMLRGASV